MSDDLYKSPESNVAIASDETPPLPNSFVVALFIIGLSLLIGLIISGVEYFFVPRTFRVKVILIWLALGILISWVALDLIVGSDVLSLMARTSTFIAIFIGLVLLGTLLTYFALSFGEKLGIRSAQKKSS